MEENEKVIENVKATLAIEGCFLESEDIKLLNDFLSGNILEEDAVNEIKSKFIN